MTRKPRSNPDPIERALHPPEFIPDRPASWRAAMECAVQPNDIGGQQAAIIRAAFNAYRDVCHAFDAQQDRRRTRRNKAFTLKHFWRQKGGRFTLSVRSSHIGSANVSYLLSTKLSRCILGLHPSDPPSPCNLKQLHRTFIHVDLQLNY